MAGAYITKIARDIGNRHPGLKDGIGVEGIAIVIEEAFDAHGIVQRLAERLSDRSARRFEQFDPYQGYSEKMREFAEDMDLWTLEQVIVRVMCEIDRKRRRNHDVRAMAEQRGIT
jgi:hypothetical protein